MELSCVVYKSYSVFVKMALSLRFVGESSGLDYVFCSLQPDDPMRGSPGPLAVVAVALCGVCAFLELYCTQALLPLLTDYFHASKTAASATISAATLAVALTAPLFGALVERLPRKTVIVCSLVAIAVPTLLNSTAATLEQFLVWRFLQGLAIPGIVAVVVTYIGEEWPTQRVAVVMSFYISGTALGGLIGRMGAGLIASWFNWRVSFVVLGIAALIGAALVALWLPPGTRQQQSGQQMPILMQVRVLLGSGRLLATYAVGFSALFLLIGVFTWITFHLSADPYHLSTAALSSLFLVYLAGLVVTPISGFLIARLGVRAGIAGALVLGIAGMGVTLLPSLPVILVGLTMVSCGLFIAQTAAQSHLRLAAPAELRVTATGIYLTCYYLGGTAAGILPGYFWELGKWPACVGFITAVVLVALAIAMAGWRNEAMENNPADDETYR